MTRSKLPSNIQCVKRLSDGRRGKMCIRRYTGLVPQSGENSNECSADSDAVLVDILIDRI